jgi:hypothetical protein
MGAPLVVEQNRQKQVRLDGEQAREKRKRKKLSLEQKKPIIS